MRAMIEITYVSDRYATSTHCTADMIYCKDFALANLKSVIYCGRQPRRNQSGDVSRSGGAN